MNSAQQPPQTVSGFQRELCSFLEHYVTKFSNTIPSVCRLIPRPYCSYKYLRQFRLAVYQVEHLNDQSLRLEQLVWSIG